MKPNLMFRKGDFITQNDSPNSFAIFGGEVYDPIHEGDGFDYSLICYYNPSHYEQDDDGKWKSTLVFECDFEDMSTCEYTINQNDMGYWRKCTIEEKDNALKSLAEKRLAWVEEQNKFRRLAPDEKICFGERNARHVASASPMSPPYRNTQTTPPPIPTRKLITLTVEDTWEQKIPVSSMDEERKELVLNQCEKLKYAFTSYGYNGVVVYPQSGAQVPRRAYNYNAGYGMCAYNQLMREADWWGYYD